MRNNITIFKPRHFLLDSLFIYYIHILSIGGNILMNIKKYKSTVLIVFMAMAPWAFAKDAPKITEANPEVTELIEKFNFCLISAIDQLYPHLYYWKHCCFKNSSTSLQPHAFTHINALEQEIAKNTYYLGYIRHIENQNNNKPSQTTRKEYLHKIAVIMNLCLTSCPPSSLEEKSAEEVDQKIINSILLTMQKNMDAYPQAIFEQTKPHHKPNHITRHWLGYSAGTLCTIGACVYMHQNKEALKTCLQETQKSTTNFFINYAYKPLKKMVNIFYDKNDSESIKASEEGIERMLRDYYHDNHAIMSPEAIEQKVHQAVEKRELPEELIAECAKEMPNILTNLLIPNSKLTRYYGKGQYIRIKAIQFEIFILRFIDLFQAHRLSIEFLLTIPAIALLYGSYKISQGVYTKIAPHNRMYNLIKKTLLTLEHLMNNNNNPAAPLNFSAQGQAYYLIYKLRTHAHYITSSERLNFLEDLAELESPNLLIDQKLLTVNRMYRTYIS